MYELPPPQLEQSWKEALEEEWTKRYLNDLISFLAKERAGAVPIYPAKIEVFNAFNHTPFDRVKVVIMGQDPYHGPKQAHGLCFSVPKGVEQPPSLKNIFKELQDDLGLSPPNHGCLKGWAEQGVLLLNAVLTVRENTPRSHYGRGWEEFTDKVVTCLSQREDPLIFVLWGKAAQEKCQHILDSRVNRHFILKAAHPSPLSAYGGFFGCRHFSKINEFLKKQGKEPVNWYLID
jgi:uracil-DNA glycosylase